MAERASIKTVLIYGAIGGALIAALKMAEYRFLVVEHALEIYGGIVALLFAALSIWLGLKLVRPRETVVLKEIHAPAPEQFVLDTVRQEQLGITKRELEILELIASG